MSATPSDKIRQGSRTALTNDVAPEDGSGTDRIAWDANP